MSAEQVKVTFQPQGRTVFVLRGTKVLEAAARAGMTIATPCGGAGTCGKCRVRFTGGDPPAPGDAERQLLQPDELKAGWRLACQAALAAEAVVEVPEGSLLGGRQQILAERQAAPAEEVLPSVRKVFVELPAPSLQDARADLARLAEQLGELKVALPLLRRLPGMLREAGFRGTAVLADHSLLDFEPGDTTKACFGAAFDVGTTTLVGSLLDLCTGRELALTSRVNPQVASGDDVLSRIRCAGEQPGCLVELQGRILGAVGEMIGELTRQANVPAERIYEVAFAGNTTMEHLLCGIDVTPLGAVPFVAAHERGLITPAGELQLPVNPRAAAYVFPVISGFVGGDTVAGLLATRLAGLDGPSLMVDIGTNGEVVLAHDGRLWAASTAAGPAFEGARISCGMRAAAGAIEKIVLDGDVRFSVIGGVAPVGICGSALIDLAAALLDCGVLTPEGRMKAGDDLPTGLDESLRRRTMSDGDGQPAFHIADGPDGRLLLTQRDVRELQLAAGAIRAGVRILLRRAGVEPGQLRRVLIAGGFGSFIRRSHAQRVGLLPPEVEHSRIAYVGNASLNGARLALLSTRARKRAEDLARCVEHVQLSEDPGFQMEFADAMIFPSG